MMELTYNTLELLAQELEGKRPEDLRLNIKLIDIMVDLNHQLHNGGEVDAYGLQEKAPTFVGLYRDVMLRDIVETIDCGNVT